ncbi:aggregation-promoting factor C-terminal-like domain-containing protein [Geodermatophilus chilensis]|uniref:aggregation-promoting factor C-terminal-like domain-containing protein n=1 Tax=Geodermatophilus chilensis TaxID=2035835 RepID=UPI000C26095C|nr:transglycosylase SLT domain-containing protein [Geodermatophilus chilensis]
MHAHSRTPRRTLHLLTATGATAVALTVAGQSVAQAAPAKQAYKDHAASQFRSAAQFDCLDQLWEAESNWNPTAQNPTSTAYGIAQFLDMTWATTGIAKTSDPYRQIDAGLIYIDERYDTACDAWAFHQANNWY